MSRGVLVTGASRGVGAEVAKAFAAAGDRVVLHCRGAVDRAGAVLAELPGEGHVVVSGDLGDPAGIPSLVEESASALGRIDVLVNNAALFVAAVVWLASPGSGWSSGAVLDFNGASHLR